MCFSLTCNEESKQSEVELVCSSSTSSSSFCWLSASSSAFSVDVAAQDGSCSSLGAFGNLMTSSLVSSNSNPSRYSWLFFDNDLNSAHLDHLCLLEWRIIFCWEYSIAHGSFPSNSSHDWKLTAISEWHRRKLVLPRSFHNWLHHSLELWMQLNSDEHDTIHEQQHRDWPCDSWWSQFYSDPPSLSLLYQMQRDHGCLMTMVMYIWLGDQANYGGRGDIPLVLLVEVLQEWFSWGVD